MQFLLFLLGLESLGVILNLVPKFAHILDDNPQNPHIDGEEKECRKK